MSGWTQPNLLLRQVSTCSISTSWVYKDMLPSKTFLSLLIRTLQFRTWEENPMTQGHTPYFYMNPTFHVVPTLTIYNTYFVQNLNPLGGIVITALVTYTRCSDVGRGFVTELVQVRMSHENYKQVLFISICTSDMDNLGFKFLPSSRHWSVWKRDRNR